MASQQRQSTADGESGRKRPAGAAPDEAQHNNGSRPSEIDLKEEESFEQTRKGAEETHVWPSMSVGGQQSSLISYGTAWHLRAAPCSSEATVDIIPQSVERGPSGRRKRPFPELSSAVRADQVHARNSAEHTLYQPHGYDPKAGRLEEEEYESALLVIPEAGLAASAPAVTPGQSAAQHFQSPAMHLTGQRRNQRCWPADRDPSAKAALAEGSTDDHDRYWDDYNPPQHKPPEDLDNEE